MYLCVTACIYVLLSMQNPSHPHLAAEVWNRLPQATKSGQPIIRGEGRGLVQLYLCCFSYSLFKFYFIVFLFTVNKFVFLCLLNFYFSIVCHII